MNNKVKSKHGNKPVLTNNTIYVPFSWWERIAQKCGCKVIELLDVIDEDFLKEVKIKKITFYRIKRELNTSISQPD